MGRTPCGESCAYIVSDGMGGHNAGAMAAELTVRTLEAHLATLPPGSVEAGLRDAFAAANSCVYSRGHSGDPATRGMGATAVVCVVAEGAAVVAHVGDSRAYLHRQRRLTRLTKDHTLVQGLIDVGVLSQTEARGHPDANVLIRGVGLVPIMDIDIADRLELKPGDEILLCTDGLTGVASDAQIEEALQPDEDPQRLADRLIALALDRGGTDNVTVQLIRYGSRPPKFDWLPR